MLELGGIAVVALIWVGVLAFQRGVGIVGVVIAIAAAGIVGWSGAAASGATNIVTSVAPTLNSVGGSGVG